MLKKLWYMLTSAFIYDEISDVKRFNWKFGLMVSKVPVHLTKRKLNERIEFMQEELQEFIDACKTQDLAEQADALIDLVYVAKGTAIMLGLPWEELWKDVQRANMSKVRGATKRGHLVDCAKPPGWTGPQTHGILVEFGYTRWTFIDIIHGGIDEKVCLDDFKPTVEKAHG